VRGQVLGVALLRDEIEAGDGTGGRKEERQIYHQHLDPALIEAHDHRGQQHGGQHDHQRVADVARKVKKGFGLDVPGRIRFQNSWEDFFAVCMSPWPSVLAGL